MKLHKSIFAAVASLLLTGFAHGQFTVLNGVSEQYISDYLDNAANPSSGYDPLVAAMTARYHGHDSLPAFLSEPFADEATERLRLSLIIEYCSDGTAYSFCSDDAMQKLIALDGDNLMPYIVMASALLHRGEEAQALAMIESGLKASTVNDYYLEKLALVRTELAARGYPADRVNMAAEGYAGAVYSYGFYDYLLNTCRVKPAQNAAWSKACFAMGEKMETLGKSWGNTVFGASIQRDVLLQTDPESAALPVILARREYYNTIRIEAAAAASWWNDETRSQVPDSFYDDCVEFGELEAIERVLERWRTVPK